MIKAVLIGLTLWFGIAGAGLAQTFTALARIDAQNSQITTVRGALSIDLALSQGIPYRVYTLADPARLIIDFSEVDFSDLAPDALVSKTSNKLRFGAVRPGWSRMVLDLPSLQTIDSSSLRSDPDTAQARLKIAMKLADEEEFAARSGAPSDPIWDKLAPKAVAAPKDGSTDQITVVLDPGHGGIDPGATGSGFKEADLMLILAQEVRDALLRSGDFNVVLTRNEDEFVSLERRVKIAHNVNADLFVSFHADALASGKANGAAVFTLSKQASDKASEALAERHNRADLLSGVDLSGQDDEVASILMDLARLENTPRSQALARGIILGIDTEVGYTYKRPIQSAGFSVLKAADIPSVLIEVGFLSSKDDLSKLTDPKWRGKMVNGIHNGIHAWLITDAADAELRRK